MKVQHATLGGDIVKRDVKTINKNTIELLKNFQLKESFNTVLNFPYTDLKVRVSACKEGAVFDMIKGDDILTTNFCCFDKNKRLDMIKHIEFLKNKIPFLRGCENDHTHLLKDKFLYTIVLLPSYIFNEDLVICGEVEFYIYYALYLGRRKSELRIDSVA